MPNAHGYAPNSCGWLIPESVAAIVCELIAEENGRPATEFEVVVLMVGPCKHVTVSTTMDPNKLPELYEAMADGIVKNEVKLKFINRSGSSGSEGG